MLQWLVQARLRLCYVTNSKDKLRPKLEEKGGSGSGPSGIPSGYCKVTQRVTVGSETLN